MSPPPATALLFLALALAAAATVTDLLWRKIPNYLTYTATLLAFGYWIVLTDWGALLFAALGFLAGLALLLLPFLTGGMGAGDVKLLAALGALVGPGTLWSLFLHAMIAGGLFAVIYLLLRGQLWEGLKSTGRLVLSIIGRGSPAKAKEKKREEWKTIGKIPYGVPIALGTAVTLIPMVL